jgi:creatinine amidohydrolase
MSLAQTSELASMSWNEVRDILALEPVGLLPIGAIEAHGPHLPLNTDVIIANAMAHAGGNAIRRTGLPAVILPSISYSVSFAGACFSGTIPVSQNSLRCYLTDVLGHFVRQSFRAICICNAHLEPAHVEVIGQVVEHTTEIATRPIVFPDQRLEPWASRLSEEFAGGSRHAGRYETSIVLAAEPERVRRTQMEELEPVWIDLPAALRAGARDFAEAGATHGYFGDPASSSREHGLELLSILGEMIREQTMQAITQQQSE